MKIIFSTALIILGSFLEVFYYTQRFQNDGISLWLAIVIGLALTTMLTLAVYYKQEKKSVWFIIIPLAIYSVVATSAGQAFSLDAQKEVQSIEEVQSLYILDEIEDIKAQIKTIDQDLNTIRGNKNKTITSLEDMGWWRSTLAAVEDTETELRSRRDGLTSRLKEITPNARKHVEEKFKSQNIYQFYSYLTGASEDFYQFILQTMLSIFIALMAPMGITIINDKSNPVKKPSTPKQIDEDTIRKWIHYSWMGIRTNKTDKILPWRILEEYLKQKGEPMEKNIYDELHEKAIKSGIIDKTGLVKEKNVEKCLYLIKGIDKI